MFTQSIQFVQKTATKYVQISQKLHKKPIQPFKHKICSICLKNSNKICSNFTETL